MINTLWYPPNSSSADVTPWDANGLNTPHAHGDYDSNTATSYGLMLAYNQFSSSTILQTSQASNNQGGGLGRKGAQRLLILETDGMANQASTVPFVNSVTSGSNPTNNSYYNIGGNNASASGDRPVAGRHQYCHANLQPDDEHDQSRFCHAHETGDHPLHRLRGPVRAGRRWHRGR